MRTHAHTHAQTHANHNRVQVITHAESYTCAPTHMRTHAHTHDQTHANHTLTDCLSDTPTSMWTNVIQFSHDVSLEGVVQQIEVALNCTRYRHSNGLPI